MSAQQPLIGPSSNFKLKLSGPSKIKNPIIKTRTYFHWKNSKENLEEISSVALLSPDCLQYFSSAIKLHNTNHSFIYNGWGGGGEGGRFKIL
jgi:hypothetical protein